MPPARAPSRLALAVVAFQLGSLACANKGEPPACLDQRQEARNLALRGEVEQAQALLDRVKAGCGPNSQSDIQHITKLIAEKTAARLAQAQQAASRQELKAKFPSRAFVDWATARGGDIQGKLAATSCAERGSPEFGFCDGTPEDAAGMSLRYWQAQPSAYRYALTTSQPPSCQDLGEFRQVRVWKRDLEQLELCELTNRRLRHLSALIAQRLEPAAGAPPSYEMYIFSQDYLGFDPAFERRLRALDQAP